MSPNMSFEGQMSFQRLSSAWRVKPRLQHAHDVGEKGQQKVKQP